MKIMFVVFQALLGGHVLSTLTVAREMQSRGHDVIFAGGAGALTPSIEGSIPFFPIDIPIRHGERETYFTWKSLAAVRGIRELIREQRVDVVHAFDARSYFHCYPAACLEGAAVLCTLCGGIDPYYNLPDSSRLIVFSEEQKAKMVREYRWPGRSVEVVRTRLDLGRMLAPESRLSRELTEQARLAPGVPKLMMISSFDDSKISSIFKVLQAVESLLGEGKRLQAVLIGGKGELHEQARMRAEAINARYGSDTVVLTGPVVDAFRLLQEATVVLGVGRSAFEGMVYAKPTVVVGSNGFAGVVSPEGIEDIAYYNFSGRNQDGEVPASVLAAEIGALMDDPDRAAAVGRFGRDFVLREIDIKQGASRIEAIYRDILQPGARQGRLAGMASFAARLVPVLYDNAAHRPKTYVKKLLHGLRG